MSLDRPVGVRDAGHLSPRMSRTAPAVATYLWLSSRFHWRTASLAVFTTIARRNTERDMLLWYLAGPPMSLFDRSPRHPYYVWLDQRENAAELVGVVCGLITAVGSGVILALGRRKWTIGADSLPCPPTPLPADANPTSPEDAPTLCGAMGKIAAPCFGGPSNPLCAGGAH
jgi:hypothetical protein